MKKCGGFVCKIVLCECKTCSNQRLCFFAQLRCLSMCSPSKHVFMFVCVHGTICFGESEIALLLFQSFWVTKRVTDFLRNLIVKQVVVPSRHVCRVHGNVHAPVFFKKTLPGGSALIQFAANAQRCTVSELLQNTTAI